MLHNNNIKWRAKVLGHHSSCSAMETHNTKFPVHSLCADVNEGGCLELYSYWVSRAVKAFVHHAPQHLTICFCFFVSYFGLSVCVS